MDYNIGDIIKVNTKSKGYVKATVLRNNPHTVKVQLLHDNHVIIRDKKRDIKDE